MATMKAIVVQEKGKAEVTEIPVPPLRPEYVKVKVVAVALNPSEMCSQLSQKSTNPE